MALLSSGKPFQTLVDPGVTDEHHAYITECEQCHEPVARDIADLAVKGTAGFRGEHGQRGEKCLACHIDEGPIFEPHGARPEDLFTISMRLAARHTIVEPIDKKIACASCHQIHQADGAGATRSLSDNQCQACHTNRFNGFADGHPEFSHLPAWSPSILFDHQQHYSDHFSKQHVRDFVPDNCSVCHLLEHDEPLRFAKFDSMCADCHLQADIVEKQLDAIGPTSLIAIPRLDVGQLAVGYWPNCKTSRFKSLSDLPLVMRRLLETDAMAVAAIKTLETQKTRLNSIKKASEEERAAATQLAWAIKRLVSDIAADNAIELFSPGSATREISDRQLAELVSLVPIDIRRRMAESWFPDLSAELAGAMEVSTGSCPDRAEWAAMRSVIEKKKRDIGDNAGWYLQAKSSYMALSYVAQNHQDPVMEKLAELVSGFSAQMQQEAEFQCSKCHGIESQDGSYGLQWTLQPTVRKTLFSHASHMTAGQSCEQCHRLTGNEETGPVAQADHQGIERDQCVVCHSSDVVPKSCNSCHRYHWQPFSSPDPVSQSLKGQD